MSILRWSEARRVMALHHSQKADAECVRGKPEREAMRRMLDEILFTSLARI